MKPHLSWSIVFLKKLPISVMKSKLHRSAINDACGQQVSNCAERSSFASKCKDKKSGHHTQKILVQTIRYADIKQKMRYVAYRVFVKHIRCFFRATCKYYCRRRKDLYEQISLISGFGKLFTNEICSCGRNADNDYCAEEGCWRRWEAVGRASCVNQSVL